MLLEYDRGKQRRFETVSRTVLDHPAKTSLRFANGLELLVVRELVEPRLDSRRSIQLLHKPLFGRLKGLNGWGLARTHELTRKRVLFKMPKRSGQVLIAVGRRIYRSDDSKILPSAVFARSV